MELASLTNRFNSKGSSSFRDNKGEFRKGKEKVSDSKGKSAAPLDKKTLNDLRRKKLCFFCKGPYELCHDYPVRPKGKANLVMWAYYEGSDSDSSEHHDEDPDEAEGEQELDSAEKNEAPELHLQEVGLSSIQKEGSFRLRVVLEG